MVRRARHGLGCEWLLALCPFYSGSSGLQRGSLAARFGNERWVFEAIEIDLDVGEGAGDGSLRKGRGNGEVRRGFRICDGLQLLGDARDLAGFLRDREGDAGCSLERFGDPGRAVA